MKDEFTTQDRNEAGALLDDGHDGDAGIRVGIGNEKCCVADDEHDGHGPDPAILPNILTDLGPCEDHVQDIEQEKEKHVPELHLGTVDILHENFIEKSGNRIQNAGTEGQKDILGRDLRAGIALFCIRGRRICGCSGIFGILRFFLFIFVFAFAFTFAGAASGDLEFQRQKTKGNQRQAGDLIPL